MPSQLGASERGERSRRYFRARGSAQVLEKAQFGLQGKPSRFLGLPLRGLGPIWLNLDSAWIGLGPISTCTIWKASMPIAAANPIANAISARFTFLISKMCATMALSSPNAA